MTFKCSETLRIYVEALLEENEEKIEDLKQKEEQQHWEMEQNKAQS